MIKFPMEVSGCIWKFLVAYADDTCISFKDKQVNTNTINGKLNQDFNTLCDWFLDNKLSIHFGEEKD